MSNVENVMLSWFPYLKSHKKTSLIPSDLLSHNISYYSYCCQNCVKSYAFNEKEKYFELSIYLYINRYIFGFFFT